MKMTWISDYEAQPGQLIEWRLHATAIAAAVRSEQDPRPPSYTQEAHVRTAAVLRDIGIEAPTWLGTAFDVPGALDIDAMEAALLHWISRHETLRSGLRRTGDEWERFTLSAEDVSLDRTARRQFSRGAEVLRVSGGPVRRGDRSADVAALPLRDRWPRRRVHGLPGI